MATTKSMKIQAEIDKVKAKISEQQARLKELEQKKRERFKFCVNRKTDIRYVISYRGQNLFFRVLSLFVL